MRSRTLIIRCATLALLPLSSLSCGDNGLGAILNLFNLNPTLTLAIQNDTGFAAVPKISTSPSDNLAEDVLMEERQVTGFGSNGAVAAGQSVTVPLTCNGDLQTIIVEDVAFQGAASFDVGHVSLDRRLRRGSDFDCQNTIRVHLTGTVFAFNGDVTIETPPSPSLPALPLLPGFQWNFNFAGNASPEPSNGPTSDEDIANTLDELYRCAKPLSRM